MSIFNDEDFMKNMLTSVESSTRGVVKVYGRAYPTGGTSDAEAEAYILVQYIKNATIELLDRSENSPEFDQYREKLVGALMDFIKLITPMNDLERLMAEFNVPDEVDGNEYEDDAAPDYSSDEMPAPEDHPGFVRTTPSGAIVVSPEYTKTSCR